MLRLASDADVNGDVIRGLRRRKPEIDLIRSQDVLPKGTPDQTVLAWAANEKRVLITNDRKSLLAFVKERLAANDLIPGVIATTNEQTVGAGIDDILLIAECMSENEIKDRIIFLPFRE